MPFLHLSKQTLNGNYRDWGGNYIMSQFRKSFHLRYSLLFLVITVGFCGCGVQAHEKPVGGIFLL